MNNRSKPGEASLGLQPKSGEDTFDQPAKPFAPIAPTTGPEPLPQNALVPEPVDRPGAFKRYSSSEPLTIAQVEALKSVDNSGHDLGGTEGFIYGSPATERMVPDPLTGAPITEAELLARTDNTSRGNRLTPSLK